MVAKVAKAARVRGTLKINVPAMAFLAMLLLLLAAAPAFADYPQNFDTSPVGALPIPWVSGNDNATCWTSPGVIDVGSSALSTPNIVSFFFGHAPYLGGCGMPTGTTAWIYVPVNASSSRLNVTMWFGNLNTVAGSFGPLDVLGVVICPSGSHPAQTCPSGSGYFQISSVPPTTTYVKRSATSAVTPGAIYWVGVYMTVTSSTIHSFDLWADDFDITGGSVVMPGATLFLLDCSTYQWFNIAAYKNSYVKVNYPSGPPKYYYNLTAPDINASLTGASLVTVWVDSSYFATVIPTSTTHQTVVLCAPNSPVLFYTLYVQDFSGQFPPGTKIEIFDGSVLLRSGYTDTGSNFQVWVVPSDTYHVELDYASNTFTKPLNLPSVTGSTIPIQILKITVSSNCGTQCTINYQAGFAFGTFIQAYYTDSAVTTTQIEVTVLRTNASGAGFILSDNTYFGSWGTFSAYVSCNYNQCNSSIADQLTVRLTFVNVDGFQTVTLPVSGGTFGGLGTLNDFWGWGSLNPTVNPLNLIAFLVVAGSAGSTGALHSKFGGIVVAGVVAALSYYGLLTIDAAAVVFLFAMAVMYFIAWELRG